MPTCHKVVDKMQIRRKTKGLRNFIIFSLAHFQRISFNDLLFFLSYIWNAFFRMQSFSMASALTAAFKMSQKRNRDLQIASAEEIHIQKASCIADPNFTIANEWHSTTNINTVSEAAAWLPTPHGIIMAHDPNNKLCTTLIKLKGPLDKGEHSAVIHKIYCMNCKASYVGKAWHG